jgi:hypothetical protein
MSMIRNDVTPNAPTPRPLQPSYRNPWRTAAPSWTYLAGLPEVIKRTFGIHTVDAIFLLNIGIKCSIAHASDELKPQPCIPHRVEVGRRSRQMPLSTENSKGANRIDWETGTVGGYPIKVESAAVYLAAMWYLAERGSNNHVLERFVYAPPAARPDGQTVARRRDPPRRDYRKADALLYPEIDAMRAKEPKLTVTGAAKRLIAVRQLVGRNVEPESVLRRLVKGYLASRPEMRHR